MDVRKSTIPVIRTKLYRSPLPRDLVRRDALCDRLDDGGHLPLILVAAPAGYGKSIFVSQWLESRAGPVAWLSLDETDGDLRVFLSYVVAAVQTVMPDVCGDTLLHLEASVLAPLPVLAGSLSNDFEELDEPLVLVLDDYHRVNDPVVHELVNQLLKHPPARLQLVVISRYDPPLALGALRAYSKVTEVRVQDLRFTLAETGVFLEQATGERFSSTALERVHQSIEGWIAGLRLAALAVQHRPDADAYLSRFDGNVREIQDFLVQEVLSQQLPATVDGLCRTSILERFCAPLCEVLGADLGDKDTDHLDGLTFIRLLEDSGLFSVALDASGEWYRYHHLFQELLRRQLEAKHTPSEISALHRRAAAWLEEHDCLEEAIRHVLRADGAEEAGRMIVRHRNDILNQEQWHRLHRWLHQLPAETIENDPELMMLQAWSLHNQDRHFDAYSILDRIEELIRERQSSPGIERLWGSIDTLRSGQMYEQCQGERALQHAERALSRLPPDCLTERGTALLYAGGARQMCGDLDEARKVINVQLGDSTPFSGVFQARLQMALCFIDWVAADLALMRLANERCRKLSKEFGLTESLEITAYFSGIIDYHQNNLAEAETSLIPIVTQVTVPNFRHYTEGVFALVSVYQAGGREEKANETLGLLDDHLLAIGNSRLMQRAQAYRADLDLRQGRLSEALVWAREFDPEPFEANYSFFKPRLTLARALIAEGEKTSLESAAVLLQRLQAFYAGIHNTRFLIEALALQALVCDVQGDESTARDLLTRAVRLALPGGFIRLFVDLGPALARLLNSLDLETREMGYAAQILSAFSGNGKAQTVEAIDHSLTKREVEILGLLTDELSNKQISDQLCISPATVKRHTEHIYQKLGVHGRRKAVTKALELSIIHTG